MGAPEDTGCGLSWGWLVLTPPHNLQPRLKSGTQLLFLFPFLDSLAADFCRVKGVGGARGIESKGPGNSHTLSFPPSCFWAGALSFGLSVPPGRAWRPVRSPAGPKLCDGQE